jgi:ribulose 1,5-bisphosphate synthetase/thiazole synthase
MKVDVIIVGAGLAWLVKMKKNGLRNTVLKCYLMPGISFLDGLDNLQYL